MTVAARPLPKGIYTPLPTFFDDNEDLDLSALRKHVKFVASAGTVPVLAGSMGEAVHLSHQERRDMISATREALDEAGMHKMPIVSGVGANSTRETIELANEAADAGADFVMAIPPGYYAGVLKSDGGEALKTFFIDVAKASRAPLIMYNFPAVSSGIDLDADLILDVVRASPNVVGTKLTCASVGKITRITAVAHEAEFVATYPRHPSADRFEVIDGFIDILLPSIAVGAAGAISGLPNFVPKTCVRLWELCQSEKAEDKKEAAKLQGLIALADGVAAGVGISGMKQMLHLQFGFGENPRRPLLPMSNEKGRALMGNQHIRRLLEEEARIAR